MSCSVVRRVALPDAFLAIDGLFETFLTVLAGFGAYPAVIRAELDRYGLLLLGGGEADRRHRRVLTFLLFFGGAPPERHFRLGAGIEPAKAEDRAEAIVLGCAGMAELAADLTAAHGLPVIDGVAAAVKLIEGLVALGVRNSRIGGYAPPLAKPSAGAFARFAPKGE